MKEKQHFFENMLKGYSGALKENALAINENYIFDNVTDENTAECAVEKLIKLDDPPTAVFCSQDPFAISGMKKARELGLSLPDDLSFFGLDDIEYSKYVHPALSTIHISRSGLANAAVGILLDLINGKEACAVKLETADISKRASVKVLTK